jgi:hypothetical protein
MVFLRDPERTALVIDPEGWLHTGHSVMFMIIVNSISHLYSVCLFEHLMIVGMYFLIINLLCKSLAVNLLLAVFLMAKQLFSHQAILPKTIFSASLYNF